MQNWIAQFKQGKRQSLDVSRSGRPSLIDDDKIEEVKNAKNVERRHIERHYLAPYSPDLNLCDRWLFPQMKMTFANRVFQSCAEIANACREF